MPELIERIAGIFLLAALLGRAPVFAGEPPKDPILRIDTGAHTAVINRLAVTRGGQLLTVSDDKTARLWGRPGSAPLTMRVPIGPGSEGALYAVALSPTKDIAVVGGFTGLSWDSAGSVYGLELSTGRITGRVETPRAKTHSLAYSNDGRYLAIGTDEKAAVRVLDLTAKAVVLDDSAYGDAVTTVQFLPDGRLVTGSLDGKIRLYDAGFHLAASHALDKPARPWRIAVAPEGDRIAIGALGSPTVQIVSAAALKPVATLSAAGSRGGAFPAVAWIGTRVFAAGAQGNSSENRLHSWDLSTGKQTDAVLASDAVSDLAALPDGTIAFATAEPSLGIFDPRTSATTWVSKRSIADFRDAGDAFKITADGSTVQFPTRQKGAAALRFDWAERTLTASPREQSGMNTPGGPCGVTHWQNSRDTRYKGKLVALQPDEYARSVAAMPDCSSVLLGADYSLRLMRGDSVAWKIDLQAPAWAVSLSRDERYAVAALGDGTIRWFDANNGTAALSLFATVEGRWIAWSDEGYFDHGDGAEDLVGYHINRGKAAGPEFIRTGQLYAHFFRPDLLTLKFRGQDLSTAVTKIGGDASAVVATHMAPELRLVGWCSGESCSQDGVDGKAGQNGKISVDAPTVALRIALKDRGSGIGTVVVRRNGAAVPATIKRAHTADQVDDYILELDEGDNHVTVSASDARQMVDAGAPIAIDFRYQPAVQAVPAGESEANLPRLHLFAVGINYEHHRKPLQNAVNDAKGMAQTMFQLRRGLFQEGLSEVLTEEQATLANLRASFKRIADAAKPNDVVVVFLAGHGIALDDGKFYYVAYDTALTEEGLKATGLTHDTLVAAISRLPATRVAVLVDACMSGAFATQDAVLQQSQDRTRMEQLSRGTGRFILAASQSSETALDGTNGHGVFTWVVLRGIKGDADGNRDGLVDVSELGRYAKSNVSEEARKQKADHSQNANFYFGGSDFFELSAPGARN